MGDWLYGQRMGAIKNTPLVDIVFLVGPGGNHLAQL